MCFCCVLVDHVAADDHTKPGTLGSSLADVSDQHTDPCTNHTYVFFSSPVTVCPSVWDYSFCLTVCLSVIKWIFWWPCLYNNNIRDLEVLCINVLASCGKCVSLCQTHRNLTRVICIYLKTTKPCRSFTTYRKMMTWCAIKIVILTEHPKFTFRTSILS